MITKSRVILDENTPVSGTFVDTDPGFVSPRICRMRIWMIMHVVDGVIKKLDRDLIA